MISSTSGGEPSSGCAGTCTSSTRPSSCRCGCSTVRPTWSASAAGWPAVSRRCRCGSHASSSAAAARSTRAIAELDQELEQRTASRSRRRCSSCPAAAPSPPRSCSPRSARSAASKQTRNSPATAASHRSKQAQAKPAPPTRPRRQPPTQRRALPNRDHPGPLPPRRTRLPRTQTSRRQKPPRSDPLPQTTPRPRRLQHTKNEPRLDIGATLAHPFGGWFRQEPCCDGARAVRDGGVRFSARPGDLEVRFAAGFAHRGAVHDRARQDHRYGANVVETARRSGDPIQGAGAVATRPARTLGHVGVDDKWLRQAHTVMRALPRKWPPPRPSLLPVLRLLELEGAALRPLGDLGDS